MIQKAFIIKVKKRVIPEWSAILIVILPFVFGFLIDFLMLPRFVKFVSDFLILFSLVIIWLKSFNNGKFCLSRKILPVVLLICVFLVYTFIGYLFNYQSALYYFWGIRNNFRFFAAFFIFVVFLDDDCATSILKFFDLVFWIHIAATVVQFFAFGYQQDFLGGVFGVQKGCNGYVIAFMSIVIIKSLLMFMNGEEKTVSCFLKCSASLLVAALAELKVFFFIFIFVLIVSAVITSFSIRKAIMMTVSSLLLMVAYTILISLFDSFDGFLSFDFLIDELFRENYASDEDLGRFTSVHIISERFLTTTTDRLFGMGLGNCDTSTISVFNTAFYDMYFNIHYTGLSVAFMFLETGWIGLILYFSFFISCLIYALIGFKKKRGNILFNQIGIIMSLLCLMLLFYNSSLRTEAGYLIYFALSLPFIAYMNSGNKSNSI